MTLKTDLIVFLKTKTNPKNYPNRQLTHSQKLVMEAS